MCVGHGVKPISRFGWRSQFESTALEGSWAPSEGSTQRHAGFALLSRLGMGGRRQGARQVLAGRSAGVGCAPALGWALLGTSGTSEMLERLLSAQGSSFSVRERRSARQDERMEQRQLQG